VHKQNISYNVISLYKYDPHLRQTFRSVNPREVVFAREEILSKVAKYECLPQVSISIALLFFFHRSNTHHMSNIPFTDK